MKTEVQYNDYVGTSAADRSDFQTLSDYLKDLGVDTERYMPIGATFYIGNQSDNVYFAVICIDNEGDKSKAVKIAVEGGEMKEVIALFKRLEVMFTQKSYKDYELIDEPVLRVEK